MRPERLTVFRSLQNKSNLSAQGRQSAGMTPTTYEKMIHIIDPTDEDLAFFKAIEDEA